MLKFVSVALRLRYLLPASAVGGYYSARRKYEDIKSSLPEMPDFIKDLLDSGKESIDSMNLDQWSASLNESARTLNEWFEEASAALQRRSQSTMSDEAREYLSTVFVLSPPMNPPCNTLLIL